jgi:hypothetical protein
MELIRERRKTLQPGIPRTTSASNGMKEFHSTGSRRAQDPFDDLEALRGQGQTRNQHRIQHPVNGEQYATATTQKSDWIRRAPDATARERKGEPLMRSDLIFGALTHVNNRYQLCQLAAKATRKLHKPNTRLQDTTNEVLDRFKDTVPMDDGIEPTVEKIHVGDQRERRAA